MVQDNILEVKDLKVYFPIFGGVFLKKIGDVKAVDGISFSIKRGEAFGLVGESGCGKTTVGKAIMHLNNVTSGEILFNLSDKEKIDLAKLSKKQLQPYRANLQMIFQDPYSSLNPRMSVADIIKEPLLIHHKEMGKKEVDERVAWLLDKVGLQQEYANRYPHEFSGGQRQRIGFARSLATNPQFIIADEPVSALDVSIQAQVINLLQDLQEELGLTYLFIAHDLSVVEHISNRIGVMYLGNLAEIGNGQEIYNTPLHPYSKALLSAVPLPDPELIKQQRMVLKGDVPSPLHKPSGCGFRTRCPIAKPDCAENIPQLKEVSSGRFVACPHFNDN